MNKFNESWHRMLDIAEKDMKKVVPLLKEIAVELREIPLKQKTDNTPKILVVGEIYVRRDDFAVDELVEFFANKGIITKISGFTEWVYYCDFVREHELKKRLKNTTWHKKIFSKDLMKLLIFKIEQAYKHWIDYKIKNALKPSGLIPDSPHNMYKIMKNSKDHFVTYDLNSEISVSSGAAATSMAEDYSGVVNISPFACLIGRVIEGLLTPWFREKKYPFMSIEIDGNLLPPNIISKLEIFSLNVLRFKSSGEESGIIKNINKIKNEDEKILVLNKLN